MSRINVTFVGVRDLEWHATDDGEGSQNSSVHRRPSSQTESPLPDVDASGQKVPQSNAELKSSFVAYLRKELGRLKADKNYSTTANECCEDKAIFIWILVAALEKSSRFRELSIESLSSYARHGDVFQLEFFFDRAVASLRDIYRQINGAWSMHRGASETGAHDAAEHFLPGAAQGDQDNRGDRYRTTRDREAQSIVPTWYGGTCVLSSSSVAIEAAHVVPVRAIRGETDRLVRF